MDNTLHLVGIAKKARRVEVGEEPVGAAARARQARLIVLARDAADNTCRRAAHFAEAGACPVVQCPYSKEELGGAVGRTSCAMLAFTDAGLAASFMGKLSARDAERYGETAEAVSAPRRPECSSASGSSAATSRSCKRPGQSPGLLPPPAARSAVWPSGAGAHRARAGRRTRSPGSRAEIPLGRRPAMAGAVEDICHRASAEPRLCGERRGGEAARPVPAPAKEGVK